MSKRRVPNKGMSIDSTRPSSTISPLRIIRDAFRTDSAVRRLAEPRSSAGPHFEGQRCAGEGGDQLCAFAKAESNASPAIDPAIRYRFFIFLPCLVVLIDDIFFARALIRYAES